MKLYVSILLILLTFFGCKKNSSKKSADYAYLGGEIINPIDDFIIISDLGSDVVDTIKLDGRNRFIYKFDNLKPGIYSFKLQSPIGLEFQTVLLEPKDSIMLRLNTLDFDESLVYTGVGAKKNNYFINEFLENEKEEKYIIKLCQLKPEDYQKRIDSLKEIKLKKLAHFTKKCDASELFYRIARANINFSYYSSKEIYPFGHYGKHKGAFLKQLPNDFYSYRKDINYNDTFFKHYNNYQMFLRSNLNNISLNTHYKHAKDDAFKWNSVCYNLDRLHLIDSLVTNETIKNELLYHFALKYISLSNNPKGKNLVLNSYLDKTNDERAKSSMTIYANSLKSLDPGSKLPDFKVVDFNNNDIEFNSLVKTPTVISFWSHIYYDHFKKSHGKLTELRKKYPEIKFITINVDEFGLEKPKQTLKDCKFNCSDQYLFKDPKASKKLLAIYPMTKTIIIDKNENIVNSNANIFSINFEEQLLGLLNR